MADKVGGLFGRLSLTDKLTAIGAATAALALVTAAAAMLVYDYTSQRTVMVRDTAMLAEVVGVNSTAAVAFADARVASETLAGRWRSARTSGISNCSATSARMCPRRSLAMRSACGRCCRT